FARTDGSARDAGDIRKDRAAAGRSAGGNGASGNSRRPQSAGENVGVDGKGSAANREGDLVAGGRGVQRELANATGGDSVRQIEFAAAGAPRGEKSAVDGRGYSGSDERAARTAAEGDRVPGNCEAEIHIRGRVAQADSSADG